MRAEYTIKITDNKGKVDTIVYPKKYAEAKALDCQRRYANTDYKVEFYKVMYIGSSFYKSERIF